MAAVGMMHILVIFYKCAYAIVGGFDHAGIPAVYHGAGSIVAVDGIVQRPAPGPGDPIVIADTHGHIAPLPCPVGIQEYDPPVWTIRIISQYGSFAFWIGQRRHPAESRETARNGAQGFSSCFGGVP